MIVRRRLGSILTAFLLIGLVGCGGDDDNGMSPEIDDLIGTWVATSLVWAEVGGGATDDLTAAGETATLVFRNDLTYSFTQVTLGPPLETRSEDGTYAVTGSVLTVTPDSDGSDAIEIVTLTSTALTLRLPVDQYDFNDDGNGTPAFFTLVFVKQ